MNILSKASLGQPALQHDTCADILHMDSLQGADGALPQLDPSGLPFTMPSLKSSPHSKVQQSQLARLHLQSLLDTHTSHQQAQHMMWITPQLPSLCQPWGTWRSTPCLSRSLSSPATLRSPSTAAWAVATCTASMPGLDLPTRCVSSTQQSLSSLCPCINGLQIQA